MNIVERTVKVRDLIAGSSDNQEGGVTGLNGTLNIRPPYQREYVYKDEQREAVIETLYNQFHTFDWDLKKLTGPRCQQRLEIQPLCLNRLLTPGYAALAPTPERLKTRLRARNPPSLRPPASAPGRRA